MGNEVVYVNQPYCYPQGMIQPMMQPGMAQNQYQKQITIKLNKYDFFKGEIVEGAVLINTISSVVLNEIHLNLYLSENWSYPEGEPSMAELNNPILLTIKIGIGKILSINSNLINLNPGNYNFPFKFKLPDYLQPSFEYPKQGKKGSLRYILEAKLISPYVQGDGKAYIFIKSRPKILNCPLSYSSAANVHKWGMIDEGSTILKVSYQNSNYQMRGQIPITVEINNTRGKLQVKSVNVKAVRRVQFKKVQEAVVKFHLEDVMVNKVFAVSVPPNTNSQTYNYTVDLKEEKFTNFNYVGQSNPYPKLVDIAYAMPTTDGAAIKCDYFLVVTLSFTSFVTKGYVPKVIVPFTLTHQLQDDYNLEQQEDDDLKKAIEASLLDMKDMKTVNEININEVENNQNQNQIQNEEILDEQKGDGNNLIDDNIDFENMNQFDDNNDIQENDSLKNINNIKNEIMEINNSLNQIRNNVGNENNMNQGNNEYNNINEINNINENNNQEINNNMNNDNININNANDANNNEINNQNNNQVNIKFDDNEEEVNPYQLDSVNNEQNNNGKSDNKQNNFSINDFEE